MCYKSTVEERVLENILSKKDSDEKSFIKNNLMNI